MSTKSIIRLSAGLFFMGLLGFIYFIAQSFLIERSEDHLKHLPENASVALRIDGASIIKNGFFEIVLQSKDEAVINLLEEQVSKRRKKVGVNRGLGIDYMSDIVIYTFPFNNKEVYGTTYRLNNPDKMEANIQDFLSQNQVYGLHHSTGVILSFPDESLSLSDKRKLELIAQQIAEKPSKSKVAVPLTEKNEKEIVKLASNHFPFGTGTIFEQLESNVTLNEHKIELKGRLGADASKRKTFIEPEYSLSQNGFHFHTTLISDEVNDTITRVFPDSLIQLAPINSFSMNYFGGEIKNTMKGLFVSPQVDLLIQFKDSFDLKEFLTQDWVQNKTGLVNKGNIFESDFIKYKFEKLSPTTYFISSSENAGIEKGWNKCHLSISGDPTRLTEIKADAMIMTFISVMSIYSSSRELFENIEDFELCIEDKGGSKATLDGTLSFKDGAYPMNEFLKFALTNRLIKLN